MARVDPFLHPIPRGLLKDAETRAFFEYLIRFLHDLWKRTGGGNDFIDQGNFGDLNSSASYQSAIDQVAEIVNSYRIQEPNEIIGHIQEQESPEMQGAPILEPVRFNNLAAGGTALTTTGPEVVLCFNTAAATVTLNANPHDGESVKISRRDGTVTVNGDINGTTSILIPSKYDTMQLVYSAEAGEWAIV